MVVEAGADEADQVGRVLRGELPDKTRDLELGFALGDINDFGRSAGAISLKRSSIDPTPIAASIAARSLSVCGT